MKNLMYSFIFSLLIFINGSALANDNSLFFEEDGRNWVYAGKTHVGEQTFVPEDDDPKNWYEAIILHYIPARNIPLEMYYETFMKVLNEKSGNAFRSEVIQNDENTLIFEWWIDPNTPGAQHGWIKVSKTNFGLQFFRYTTKKIEEVDNIKSQWKEILRKYNFKITPERINYNVDFTLDGRDWIVADDSKMNKIFYLNGENEDNWSERFSISLFDHSGVSPYTFYHNTIADLNLRSGMKVKSKIIQSDNESIFFEWWFPERPHSQREWYKLKYIAPNLASGIKYTMKNSANVVDSRNTWEKIIDNASPNINFKYNIVVDRNYSKNYVK
ncbi:MAG: hypothetical protein VX777_05225 [Chlamydiota bacterium]|nr:hypothetical protein [Chlamydiota bacterium]